MPNRPGFAKVSTDKRQPENECTRFQAAFFADKHLNVLDLNAPANRFRWMGEQRLGFIEATDFQAAYSRQRQHFQAAATVSKHKCSLKTHPVRFQAASYPHPKHNKQQSIANTPTITPRYKASKFQHTTARRRLPRALPRLNPTLCNSTLFGEAPPPLHTPPIAPTFSGCRTDCPKPQRQPEKRMHTFFRLPLHHPTQ